MIEKRMLTVSVLLEMDVERVWHLWNDPKHVVKWNSASPDWHTPSALNDLRNGGSFSYRMESKDGTMGFDYGGIYLSVLPRELLEIELGDGRALSIYFKAKGKQTEITEVFEAEAENSIEDQQFGWQAILNNFKHYAESVGNKSL